MAVKILELHDHGIRIGPSETEVKECEGFLMTDPFGNMIAPNRHLPLRHGRAQAGRRVELRR